MAKKWMCIMIAAALVLAMVPAGALRAHAYTQIMDHEGVSGRTYSSDYAQKLDAIFSGEAQLFSNTTARFALGDSLNNRKAYQIADVISGYQCYIYAQAVYYYLFGDIPYTGNGLVYWSNSSKIMENQSEASYELFRQADVGFGAYVRTTTNRNGTFNGSGGHSFIILSYDEEQITYLEGNANGYGLVCITTRTWSEFNTNQLGGRNRKICHIVQQNDITYCPHDDFDGLGDCLGCRYPFDWESTLDLSCAGIYWANGNTVSHVEPYEEAATADAEVTAGALVEVLGSCVNAAGEVWYRIEVGGVIGYVPEAMLEYDGPSPLRVSCSDFSPSHRAVLEKKSQPVMGTVVSNAPLARLCAYLDGHLYATWYAENETTTRVDVRQTQINSLLTFATLTEGMHTIELEAYALGHSKPVRFLQHVFYINVKTVPETYTVTFQANGGSNAPNGLFVTGGEKGTLPLQQPVREGYTFLGWATDPAATQALYQSGDSFVVNADTTLYALWRADTYTLSGVVTSYLADGEVTLELLLNGEVIRTTTVSTMRATYTMDGLRAGRYTLRVSKAGHATREYSLMVGKKMPMQDVNLCPVGDVTGDGTVNVKDYQRMLRHINKLATLEDYALTCGDVTGDGKCTVKDIQRLQRHVNKIQPLF